MNDDYLWDRTGEPDPEIKQLEELLGTLRYQPQPLALEESIRSERRRRYFAPLAIAAAIALMILAGGLWVRIHRSQTSEQQIVKKQQPATEGNTQPLPALSPGPNGSHPQLAEIPQRATFKAAINPRHRATRGNSLAQSRDRHPRPVTPQNEMSIAEPDEVRAAKEQLMLALRLASAKLNFAQRKTQGPPSTIRNQHKVG